MFLLNNYIMYSCLCEVISNEKSHRSIESSLVYVYAFSKVSGIACVC